MNLVAMMIVRNEIDRYLRPVIAALQKVCDEIRVYDDGSTDDTPLWLAEQERVSTRRIADASFFRHEGRARQEALRWAMNAKPTHILAVDADELLENGQALRDALDDPKMFVWMLGMEEIWKADEHFLYVREDGGWRSHPVPVCYRTVRVVGNQRAWMIPQRALASGRVPLAVARNGRKATTIANLLHLGWACEADRQARYQRYVDHDGGRFHRSTHLDSIMWPDTQVKLRQRVWPQNGPIPEILERIRRNG